MSSITGWGLPTVIAGMLTLTATSVAQQTAEPVHDASETSSNGMAQEDESNAQDDATADGATPMISVSDVSPVLEPVNDYTGAFPDRTTITGDWGGLRQDMLESGFAINASLTQTFRVVASGGVQSGDTAYNALFDYGITLDTARLGLWPGGYIAVNAQSAFASGLPLEDGAVSPSDYNVVFPTLERPTTELMEYYIIQGLSETMALMFGRVDPVAWDRNRFAFDPRTQFMNGSISQQLLVGGLVSFSTYTAALAAKVGEHVNILGGVYDPVIRPGEFTSPFSEYGLFTVVDVNWELADDLSGTARFLGVYDNSDGTAFDNERLILDEILSLDAETKSGNWIFGINFEQYLWKPENTADMRVGAKNLAFSTASFGFQEPGLGFFARAAVLPESRNLFQTSVSLGLAGRGLVPGRPLDRMGVGGYWLQASGDLGGLTDALIGDEWGGEIYYNYAITPSIQLSVDFQYIDPATNAVDNPFVVGMRLFTQF